jgi:hypothetical protein
VASFEELAINSGVDTLKPGDSWVIVPQDGNNQVLLREAAGYKLALESDGGKVGLSDGPAPGRGKNDRLIKLTAQKNGLGRLRAINGSAALKIGFSVHPRKSLKIAFFFLEDLAGNQPTRRSKFTPSEAPGWVKDLNGVFGPQANMWFDLGAHESLPLANLPQVISSRDVPTLAAKKSAAPINIFLAGAQITSNDHNFPNGFYSTAEKVIVLKDQSPTTANPKPMLKTIAHEIAHLLNFMRSVPTPGHDYYQVCGYQSDVLSTHNGADIKIPHQRVLDWNPW